LQIKNGEVEEDFAVKLTSSMAYTSF